MSNGDPIGSDAPKGKSNAQRKGRYDGGYTGTEQRVKDQLMRQFMRTGEGPGAPSEAYRNASCWCACGRLKADDMAQCVRCSRALNDALGVEEIHGRAWNEHLRRLQRARGYVKDLGIELVARWIVTPHGWFQRSDLAD